MQDELMIHDLSAAYALNALDAQGERFYERHLGHCTQCQADVATFSGTVSALAYAAPSIDLPPALRPRILAAIRVESANARARNRWTLPATAVAAAAVCAGIGGLAIWAAGLHSHPASFASQRTLPLTGAKGTVVRSGDGEATMVISGLHAAPNGKTYEAWVMQNGTAIPAGLFRALRQTTVVHLTKRVPQGARVGVTIEIASGAKKLNHRPLFSSARA